MVISLRKLARWVQMVLLICLFSFVLFKMMEVVHVWIQPTDKYREPKGESLKVNSDFHFDQWRDDWAAEVIHRLKVFYFIGE
ncbi:DUF4227 family protein [Effusibacillus consociatus]|uniref:DUF4227 family protein n=1 Tax=Effusibacillus consociatus TaxID=1117041 RepID=A0ABV9PZM0_9BACL